MSRVLASMRDFLRRHAAMLALSAGMLALGVQSLDCFLKSTGYDSDDHRWLMSCVEHASRPWRLLGPEGRLFGSYFRPVPHMVWMANYYAWGFEMRGHQATLIALWLAAPWFAYAIGMRLHGRTAGFLAAVGLGLNQVYLLVVSWKSWFTTVTELVLVLACVWAFLTALAARSRRWLAASAALALLAVLSRELAPLVLSAVVFATVVEPPIRSHRWTWRRAGWGLVWAAATLAVLVALPTYREALLALARAPFRPAPAAPATADGGFSAGYLPRNLSAHLESLFRNGFYPWVLLIALLADEARRRDIRRPVPGQRHTVLLGAFVALMVLPTLARLLMRGVFCLGDLLAGRPIRVWQGPGDLWVWVWLTLTALFVWAAARGRKLPRMLAAWFVVSFVPILFLEHRSGAYHLLALTAMTLYVGAVLAREVHEVVLPTLRTLTRRTPPPADWGGLAVHAALVVAALGGFGWMLAANVLRAMPTVVERADQGRADRQAVEAAVATARERFASRTAWTMPEDRARLAGVMLRQRYGFAWRQARPDDGPLAWFRPADLPLPLYEKAVPCAETRGANRIPNGDFEGPAQGATLGGPGYRGGRALLLRLAADEAEDAQRVELSLPPPRPGPCAFGAVVRSDAGVDSVSVRLHVETAAGTRAVAGFRYALQEGWDAVAGCAQAPPGARSLRFEAVLKRRPGAAAAALVDDVFVIPAGVGAGR